MKPKNVGILAVCLVILSLGVVDLRASDPVGIFAVIDKVVFEPNETSPQRIQIWGAFSLAKGRFGSDYEPPQIGYLYFTVKPGQEEICRKEWADLKSVAGTRQAVTFASRYNPIGRVRKEADKLDTPDVYPTGMGVTKVQRRQEIIGPLLQATSPRK